jgi:hypothetical protein
MPVASLSVSRCLMAEDFTETAAIRSAEAEKACATFKAKPLFAGQVDGQTEESPTRYAAFCRVVGAD